MFWDKPNCCIIQLGQCIPTISKQCNGTCANQTWDTSWNIDEVGGIKQYERLILDNKSKQKVDVQ
jgi:hypothetical protein